MFRGSSVAKIDSKGRLKVPSDFRRNLETSYGAEVFITSVRGDSALLYPLPVWEGIEARLAALPTTDRSRQRFQERVSYFGQQTRLDAQGRLVVPPILRDSAEIVGEVIVFGNIDHFEIWNRSKFQQRLDAQPFTDEDFGDLSLKGI